MIRRRRLGLPDSNGTVFLSPVCLWSYHRAAAYAWLPPRRYVLVTPQWQLSPDTCDAPTPTVGTTMTDPEQRVNG